jgi:hypothetical protein
VTTDQTKGGSLLCASSIAHHGKRRTRDIFCTKLLVFAFFSLPLSAQNNAINIMVGKPRLAVGETTPLSIFLGMAGVTGLQFDLNVNARLTVTGMAVTPTGTARVLTCSSTTTPMRCTLDDPNLSTIPIGTVITAILALAPGTTTPCVDCAPIQLTGVLAAGPVNTVMSLIAGPALAITVLGPREDLNSDGKVDTADIIEARRQVVTRQCTTADVFQAGSLSIGCDIYDVIAVIIRSRQP